MESEARIVALLDGVGIDANAATELLIVASEYLERGDPLPKPLSQFLARSLNAAMHEPSANRANELVRLLGLAADAKQGRPAKSLDFHEVSAIVGNAFEGDANPSERQVNKRVAKQLGVSPNTASKQVKPAMLVPKILRNNGLDSLIPPRGPKKD